MVYKYVNMLLVRLQKLKIVLAYRFRSIVQYKKTLNYLIGLLNDSQTLRPIVQTFKGFYYFWKLTFHCISVGKPAPVKGLTRDTLGLV